ncbi:3-oxoacyl-ACP synthase III family protein [Streptomyces cyanogenus]|uniref:3-oxoacyl-[acyl-carrier-protein] synthase 3 n=1 Tax=Streptomyces cyanogenus TaxID=80860 RepID=A0ABX7TJD3_STRCY|nr:3-oxoacyl-ACP synthase III family protein [Streptomyces cyanogenus]QTD96682.1 3-oxoacyl-[acyl-carrier-protein] synthase 3 [Streptomyces cyanogenus]
MTNPPFFIAGTGAALPGSPVSNDEMAEVLGVSPQWMELFSGIRCRHLCWDPATGDLTHSLADLCEEAADAALNAAGLSPSDLDFLILSTSTPDTLLPTTATVAADRLGLKGLPVYQLQAGCSGAVQALEMAGALIAAGRRTGLVVGGEVTDRFLDISRRPAALPGDDSAGCLLLGDAAGAAAITADPVGACLAVSGLVHRFEGLGRAPGRIVDWNGAGQAGPGRRMLYEDHEAVGACVPALAVDVLDAVLAGVDWQWAEIRYLLPPQLSGRTAERFAAGLGMEGPHEISCVAETGNAASALPLLQLDRLAAEAEEGDRAVALVVEPSKWIVAGLALERVRPAAP